MVFLTRPCKKLFEYLRNDENDREDFLKSGLGELREFEDVESTAFHSSEERYSRCLTFLTDIGYDANVIEEYRQKRDRLLASISKKIESETRGYRERGLARLKNSSPRDTRGT